MSFELTSKSFAVHITPELAIQATVNHFRLLPEISTVTVQNVERRFSCRFADFAKIMASNENVLNPEQTKAG